MATKRSRQNQKTIKKAKQQAAEFDFELTVGEQIYQFSTDLFDLENENIGMLNEQITAIPANLAYISKALGEAEKLKNQAELNLEIFMADHISLYQDEKSETAKKTRVIHNYGEQYSDLQNSIAAADHLVRIIKGYRDGVEAKYQLAQTLSANLRTERESFGKMG